MVLITGISGNIGRRMAARYIKQGVDFVGIDSVNNYELPEYRFKRLDIRDPSLGGYIERNGIDSIFHLAFCTKPKIDSKTRDDIDINGAKNIVKSAVQYKVKRIVFASSTRVYGNQNREGGMYDTQGNYVNPADDLYAQNKIKAEKIFLDAANDYGIKVAILRLAIVCWKGGGAGIGDMIKAVSKSGRFFTLGNKNPSIQLVHIADVIDAFGSALGKEGIFDVASEGKMTLIEMFSEAARLGGKSPKKTNLPEKPLLWTVGCLWKLGLSPIPPLYLKLFGCDITRDISKTISMLGRPGFTINQILKEIVEG